MKLLWLRIKYKNFFCESCESVSVLNRFNYPRTFKAHAAKTLGKEVATDLGIEVGE
jgi:hypothetical protein